MQPMQCQYTPHPSPPQSHLTRHNPAQGNQSHPTQSNTAHHPRANAHRLGLYLDQSKDGEGNGRGCIYGQGEVLIYVNVGFVDLMMKSAIWYVPTDHRVPFDTGLFLRDDRVVCA